MAHNTERPILSNGASFSVTGAHSKSTDFCTRSHSDDKLALGDWPLQDTSNSSLWDFVLYTR
jgi:hypothetical protein